MKYFNLKIACTIALLLLSASTFAQVSQMGNGFPGNATDYVGWNATRNFPLTVSHKGNFPILFETDNTQRMHINPSTANTSGFVGINTTNPLFRLHVRGSGTATGQGWRRGIMLSNQGALMWNGAPHTNRNFFMAHSSSSPVGNFNAGYSTGIGSNAPVNYVSTAFVTTNPSGGPDGSKEIRKWFVS